MSRVLIQCENLSLGYEGQTVAEGLSFTAHEGEYWYVLGENGSGKTTLMKAILGLHEPLHGSITFARGIRKSIGFLPQQTPAQRDFPATVWEVVLSGCLGGHGFSPFYTKQEKQAALENMERLEIASLAKRSYKALSGGQQQRALLARALCAAQKMLLLDEPVTGLDAKTQEEFYELVERLNRGGITVLMISHDVSAAVRYATHILHMGVRPLFVGKKEDYLASAPGTTLLQNLQTQRGAA